MNIIIHLDLNAENPIVEKLLLPDKFLLYKSIFVQYYVYQ